MDFLYNDNCIKAFLRAAIAVAVPLFWRRLNIKHGGLWGMDLAQVGAFFAFIWLPGFILQRQNGAWFFSPCAKVLND